MDLGNALYHMITGRSARTEVNGFAGALKYVSGRYGSKAAAARALGVAPSTFRGWLSGRRPKADRAAGITGMAQRMQRRARLPKNREKRIRGMDPATVTMVAKYDYDDREQFREVPIGRYLNHTLGDRLIDAYLDGAGTTELAEIFHDGISEAPFYERTFDPSNPDDEDGWDIRSIRW